MKYYLKLLILFISISVSLAQENTAQEIEVITQIAAEPYQWDQYIVLDQDLTIESYRKKVDELDSLLTLPHAVYSKRYKLRSIALNESIGLEQLIRDIGKLTYYSDSNVTNKEIAISIGAVDYITDLLALCYRYSTTPESVRDIANLMGTIRPFDRLWLTESYLKFQQSVGSNKVSVKDFFNTEDFKDYNRRFLSGVKRYHEKYYQEKIDHGEKIHSLARTCKGSFKKIR